MTTRIRFTIMMGTCCLLKAKRYNKCCISIVAVMWLLVYSGNVVRNVVTGTKIGTRSITSLQEVVRQHEGVGRDRGKKVSTRRGM